MLIANFFAWSTIGGDGFNHVTVDINPAPVNAMVTVSIAGHGFGTGNDGIIECAGGIVEYSIRNDRGQGRHDKVCRSQQDNIGFG